MSNFKQVERRAERLGVSVGLSNAAWRGEHEGRTVSLYYSQRAYDCPQHHCDYRVVPGPSGGPGRLIQPFG